MDFYSASGMSLLWICFFETIAVSWLYGVDKFSDNIQDMTGNKPFVFWYYCWKFFAPALMAVRIQLAKWQLLILYMLWTDWRFFQGVFVYYIISYSPVTYGSYEFPQWAEIMGLMISFSSMIWIPAYMVYYLCSQPGSFREVTKHTFFLVVFNICTIIHMLIFSSFQNWKRGITPNIKMRKDARIALLRRNGPPEYVLATKGDATGNNEEKDPSAKPFLA